MGGEIALAEMAAVIGAQPNAAIADLAAPITEIVTDTRKLAPGSLFLALVGERFDAHQFVSEAIAAGAVAAVVSHNVALNDDYPLLRVACPLRAYQQLGHWWRQRSAAKIIAITGSVGKTTTKELLAAALSTQGSVLKTQANYNNEIGVPKTLLSLKPTHQFGVVEMGMRAAGEIALLSQIAQPDVAVITNVGTAHIGRLGSEQAIANAKCELLAEMPSTSLAILNYDNKRLIKTAATVWQGRQITYGLSGGDIQGQLATVDTLVVAGVHLPLPLPGEHNALNYLAAIAVMQALDLDWRILAQGISVELPAGRSQRRAIAADIWLLDETYNAGVESMTAALRLLAQTPGQRHLAVLGTMKELGARSPEFHYQVGQVVRQLQLDYLFILADPAEAEALAEGAAPVPSEKFDSHAALLERVREFLRTGDRLLLKASRAVALDQIADQLCPQSVRANP
ncbi:MAG: UDP-N-acetylmuramoyl-tripeptide--D-alanyl-D-alanine ligase [Leptolyngbyaceae cyanobacterium SL_1_1]|nr:UDP-N-acetylmuramoyl-tripeptide--D-alanyl-D-alanine ligase [Leptolyngbyaceae cyanobacterium RM1_1_2]NJO09175.1 UDP-N-acetylmuramoyl-tripeptide--D-alanyl-D-alanine ligase [Leptolyngbyaceae cyanobacterium SL_1_1]